MRKAASLTLSIFCLLTLLLTDARADTITIIVRSAAGSDPASIQTTVDQFRADLGNPNNGNAPGPLPGGRREINWDGGGSATTPAGTPFAGFQVIRGALFTTPGTGFVQAPPSGLATTFANPTYETIFQTFSPLRLFAVVGNNLMDVTFTIPGFPGESALTSGFGAVFTDVDLANTTSLEFFDINNLSLGTFSAPTANNGLSFLGASFGEPIISRVRITLGNTPLGPNDGNSVDVVGMDDFIYGEPQAPVPEPATLISLGTGLLVVGAVVRKRYNAKSRY
ncbi:MAG: PEP-CTERM sorting domain-containing protein [Pyrinomonadaceae bacterium]|nr:PEP-CTERM sorting domain-containing protein [Pyrinomonadaceae bacterium]